jgi:exodeoxyribonuclease-3
MKIISYNVNGLRAALEKDFLNWLRAANPDVLCLQETKLQPEQISTKIFEELGYSTYWFSAEKKGYSGVAVFSKIKPIHAEYGMKISRYDLEGRVLRLDFDEISVMSVYMPSGTSGDERQAFKYLWLDDFYVYIEKLQKEKTNLLIAGDFNIAHREIDIHHPERHHKMSGFLPEERAWFGKFLELGFTDSFRMLNQEAHQYSWWSYRSAARKKNLGWRIDYQLISNSLREKLSRAALLSEAVHSDHCPTLAELRF